MIVITYVARTDGPIFRKTQTVLSVGWPLLIEGALVIDQSDLRKLFHSFGIKDFKVQEITPQDYPVRKLKSLMFALASEIVFLGYDKVEVIDSDILFESDTGLEFQISLNLDSYKNHSDMFLPEDVENLLGQYYSKSSPQDDD